MLREMLAVEVGLITFHKENNNITLLRIGLEAICAYTLVFFLKKKENGVGHGGRDGGFSYTWGLEIGPHVEPASMMSRRPGQEPLKFLPDKTTPTPIPPPQRLKGFLDYLTDLQSNTL